MTASQFRLTVSSEPEAPEQHKALDPVGEAEDTDLAKAGLALETKDELGPCGTVTARTEESQPDTGDTGYFFGVSAGHDSAKGYGAGPVERGAIGPSDKVTISEEGQVGKR